MFKIMKRAIKSKKDLLDREYYESLKNIFFYNLFFAKNNKIIFYDIFPSHYQFSHDTIEKLLNDFNQTIILFVSDKKHKSYSQTNKKNLHVFYISFKHINLFQLLEKKIFVTVASHMHEIAKPRDSMMIHMFHSLVSMHYIYSENAFDTYDVFFAVGPHHIQELERTAIIRNWQNKRFLKIGYPKLDYFTDKGRPVKQQLTTILLAPSWLKYNLLKLHGLEIIEKVIALNYTIIVRPHPHSFIEDHDIINQIKNIAKVNKQCILEDSNKDGMISFQKADLLISDWSGAAYEYAFGLLKPVLFIDVPPKIADGNIAQKDFPPMESVCRNQVGYITFMDEFEMNLLRILNDETDWKEKITQVRPNYLYNFGNAAIKAAEAIVKIKEEIQ